MAKGRRSIFNWLLSGVSIPAVYLSFSCFTVLIGVMSYFALGQVERGVAIFIEQYSSDPAAKIFTQSVHSLKIIVLSAFISIAVFIFLFGRAIRSHIFNQSFALCEQIDSYLRGDLEKQRKMRRHDELKPVMEKLHLLVQNDLIRKGKA